MNFIVAGFGVCSVYTLIVIVLIFYTKINNSLLQLQSQVSVLGHYI